MLQSANGHKSLQATHLQGHAHRPGDMQAGDMQKHVHLCTDQQALPAGPAAQQLQASAAQGHLAQLQPSWQSLADLEGSGCFNVQ